MTGTAHHATPVEPPDEPLDHPLQTTDDGNP